MNKILKNLIVLVESNLVIF